MSGRSLCTQRVPRTGTRCDGSAAVLGEMQRASPCLGPPRAPGQACGAHHEPPECCPRGRTRQRAQRMCSEPVWRRLSADGISSSSSASASVCHRLCSGCSDAKTANNAIVARIFGLRLPGQAESPQQGWGRMATRNGGISAREEWE